MSVRIEIYKNRQGIYEVSKKSGNMVTYDSIHFTKDQLEELQNLINAELILGV